MLRQCFLLFIFLISNISCKEQIVGAEERQPFISSIDTESQQWSFEYDSDKRLIKSIYTFGSESISHIVSFVYNDLDQVIRTTQEAYGTKKEFKYEYDDSGSMTAVYKQSPEGLFEQSFEFIYEENRISIKPPNTPSIAGNTYFINNDNVNSITCFDCGTSVFKFEYFDMESVIPESVRKYWGIYTYGTSGIPFLNEFSQIGSKKLLKYYWTLMPFLIVTSVSNQVVLEEKTGLPVSVQMVLEELNVGTEGKKIGDVLNTYQIEYVYL